MTVRKWEQLIGFGTLTDAFKDSTITRITADLEGLHLTTDTGTIHIAVPTRSVTFTVDSKPSLGTIIMRDEARGTDKSVLCPCGCGVSRKIRVEEQPCALCGDSRSCPMCDTDDGPKTRDPQFLANPANENTCPGCGREDMPEGCTSDDCPSNNPTPTEKITANTVGTIISIAPHETKENVYIILGREDDRLDGFFTREASGETGAQFWGHYRLTLAEAHADYEERLGRAHG